MADYWNRKNELSAKAKMHAEGMEKVYPRSIARSVENSIIYGGDTGVIPDGRGNGYEKGEPQTALTCMDSVSALFSLNDRRNTCVLNFASYKHPGGMFLEGSHAQEECLCHESTLYNVLKRLDGYYAYNSRYSEKSLYTDRAVYSPGITFIHGGKAASADVLTCAAPNLTAAEKFHDVTHDENTPVLKQRIRFILNIIREQECRTAILGAWGCGVFGQDPVQVAEIFEDEIRKVFRGREVTFIFAVPGVDSPNYAAFYKVFVNGSGEEGHDHT